MNKNRILTASVLVIALLVSTAAFAQDNKTGINGATFLKIGVGARQVALGSAAATLEGDPTMMFWNPAGIASVDYKTSVSINHNEWLIGMNHDAFAVTHDIGFLGTVGLGVIYVGMGDITADRDIAPTPETRDRQADMATGDTYSFYNLAANLTISRRFTDKLALGASVKLIQESIDDQSASTIAGDFGVIYQTGWNDLVLGAHMSNLGGDLSYYESDFGAPIPLIFSIGASMNLAKQENTKLTGLLDATKRQDTKQLYFGGVEWNLFDKIALRSGYKFALSGSEDTAGIQSTDEGASFGAGVWLPFSETKLRVDYAFTQFNILDSTHRFSLNVSF
jgi:hypothetical protein